MRAGKGAIGQGIREYIKRQLGNKIEKTKKREKSEEKMANKIGDLKKKRKHMKYE